MKKWVRALLGIIIIYVALVAIRMPFVEGRIFHRFKAFYDINVIAFPLALLAAATAAFLWSRRRNTTSPFAVLAAASAIAVFGLRFYAERYEPYQLKVRTVQMQTDKIDAPLRILHISDIQTSRVGAYEESVVARIKSIDPDLIIHTGDLIQTDRREAYHAEYTRLAALLAELTPPLGMYNVIGDTDGYLRKRLLAGGVLKTLNNESAEIQLPGGHRLRLLGIGVFKARKERASRRLVGRFIEEDPAAFNLAYAHPPDFAVGITDLPLDLALAGHTHGGQIRIPFFGPPVTASRIPRDLARGFHPYGRTHLNVSAGIGAERAAGLPPIRINCPPEMTLLTLVPRPEPQSGGAARAGLQFKR